MNDYYKIPYKVEIASETKLIPARPIPSMEEISFRYENVNAAFKFYGVTKEHSVVIWNAAALDYQFELWRTDYGTPELADYSLVPVTLQFHSARRISPQRFFTKYVTFHYGFKRQYEKHLVSDLTAVFRHSLQTINRIQLITQTDACLN